MRSLARSRGFWLSLFLCGFATNVHAQQRVAVERFSGPQAGQIRNLLVQDLEANGFEVVGASEVRDASRETVGHTRLRDDDYPQVAAALRVVAFIDGSVRRARRRWTLRVIVRNAADGMRIGTESWGGRTIASLRAVRRNGFTKLEPHLQIARAPAGTAEPETAHTEAVVVDPNATPWYAGDGDGEGAGEEEDGDEEEDDEPTDPTEAGRLGYFKLRFDVLLGVVNRSLHTSALVDPRFRRGSAGFPTSADVDGDGDLDLIEESREYDSRGLGHGELGFSLQLHPGMFSDTPVVPWLGLVLSYRHSVLLKSEGFSCLQELEPPADNFVTEPGDPPVRSCPATDTVPVATSQDELFAGLRADFNAGDDPAGPWIRVDLGYGMFRFRLDPDDLSLLDRTLIVPPISYSYINAGFGAKYGLHDLVWAAARFNYRFGIGVGDDARRIWGSQTGGARGFLLGVDLDHHMKYLSEGVHVTLSFDYFRFTTAFRGQVACDGGNGNCPDYSLWEPWATFENQLAGGLHDDVKDTYFRIGLAIGYEYN